MLAGTAPTPAAASSAAPASAATARIGTRRGRPASSQPFSTATSAIESPTSACTASPSGRTRPSAASASVMLCATVKPVTIVTTSRARDASSSRPSRNTRWS